MGTRSLTVFVDEWVNPKTKKIHERELVVLYRQMDGYPTGHGADLKDFLSGMEIVDGLGGNQTKVANGMGCLAAQVIGHFKDGKPGNFYVHAAKERDCGEEYIYVLRPGKNGKIRMQVYAGCITMFGLPGTKQENMGLAFDGLIEDFDPEEVEGVAKDIRAKAPNDFLDGIQKKKAKKKTVSA